MASRTELRATPIDAASSGSGGMRSPGLSSLLRMASVRQLMTLCTTDPFFKFFTYPGVSFIIFSFYA